MKRAVRILTYVVGSPLVYLFLIVIGVVGILTWAFDVDSDKPFKEYFPGFFEEV